MDPLLTAQDIAKILNISVPYAYQLIRQGAIPAVGLGRSRRVSMADLEKFIQSNRLDPPLALSEPSDHSLVDSEEGAGLQIGGHRV